MILYQTKISYIFQKQKNEEKKKKSHFLKLNNDINKNINNNISNCNNLNNRIPSKKIKRKNIKRFKKENNKNKINNDIIIEPPAIKLRLNKKNKKSNPIKQKRGGNLICIRNIRKTNQSKNALIKEIKEEEKVNKKYKRYNDIFNKFNELTENEIFELHNKTYTKTDNELNRLD